MRKTCVRWAKPVLLTLFAAAAIILGWSIAPLSAQSADPSTQPRLGFADLTYVGGFRLPANAANGDTFEFGGLQLAFNPGNNSLFVGSRAGRVAEVSIPGFANSTNPAAMPFATYLQGFSDPTEGHLSEVGTPGYINLDALMVVNNRLYGTASIFYDGLNEQRRSHYSRSLRLDEPSFSGWSAVWQAEKTGFVSGKMAVIPAEWRARLGGDAITGQFGLPVISRQSWGPAAFAFNTSQIGQPLAPASPLLYYTGDHATLGIWSEQNSTYGLTTAAGGVAIIAGTRTVLYFGRNGMGTPCYGIGTSNQALIGTISWDGAHYCYDPASSDKGTHAYPYRYQIWAYDLNDFAAVKAGTKQPWEVVPYGVWPLDLPTPEPTTRLGGVGYDPVHQLLYVSQMYADIDGYAARPVIHVLQINAAGSIHADSIPPDTTPVTTPPVATAPPVNAGLQSTVVTSISLAVNRNAPQVRGTAITFTASVVGGVTPHEYKWMLFNGSDWQVVKDWSTIESFTWTPGTANANYRVGVWARSSGNTKDEAEASVSTPFAITAPAPVAVRSVTFSPDKPAPQAAGTAITFTATVDGGLDVQYKWLVHDGNAWGAVTGWTPQNALAWTPASANPNARIGLWVRSNGNTNDVAEKSWSMDFPITAPAAAPVVAPAPAPSAGPIRSVTFGSDQAAPQQAGTTITFTAAVDGGSAIQYKWLVHDGQTWTVVAGWSTQNTFSWTPAVANANTRIGLWVRGNGNTNDVAEASWSVDFPISASAGVPIHIDTYTPPATTTTPPSPVTAVVLSTDKASPQVHGTTMVVSATATGGGTGTQYRWLIHDGVQWNVVSGWTPSSTFSWTPAIANPSHAIGVWVRRAGSTSDTPEATMSQPFVIQ